MLKYITILFLILSTSFSFAEEPRTLINFLPDGTEIKIENNKVFAVCDGKFVIVPDGYYILADGSEMTVKNGKLFNKKKSKKWETYPDKASTQTDENDTAKH